ncbi:MAG: GNAT family N-acetyltransferase [Alphaproteobacteria bacterium]
MKDAINIRPAGADDLHRLTEIAHAAKASWGYPPGMMAKMTDALTATEKTLATEIVRVAETDEGIAGWISYMPVNDKTVSVEGLWIDPDAMGKAVGRRLWDSMEKDAIANGFKEIEVLSDPNAYGFYEKMGCTYSRDEPSDVFGADRLLPLLLKRL